MVEVAMLAGDNARFRSLHGNGARTWFSAVPTSLHFTLNACNYRWASYMRLGLSIPVSERMTTCHYGATLDNSGNHLLTCKVGGGPIWTHESIASVWSDCLRELNIQQRRKPRHHYSNSDGRPDSDI